MPRKAAPKGRGKRLLARQATNFYKPPPKQLQPLGAFVKPPPTLANYRGGYGQVRPEGFDVLPMTDDRRGLSTFGEEVQFQQIYPPQALPGLNTWFPPYQANTKPTGRPEPFYPGPRPLGDVQRERAMAQLGIVPPGGLRSQLRGY